MVFPSLIRLYGVIIIVVISEIKNIPRSYLLIYVYEVKQRIHSSRLSKQAVD